MPLCLKRANPGYTESMRSTSLSQKIGNNGSRRVGQNLSLHLKCKSKCDYDLRWACGSSESRQKRGLSKRPGTTEENHVTLTKNQRLGSNVGHDGSTVPETRRDSPRRSSSYPHTVCLVWLEYVPELQELPCFWCDRAMPHTAKLG